MDDAELEAAYQTAREQHRAGRLTEAVRLYRAFLRERPGAPRVLALLGLALHQQGAHERGLALMREAVRRKPEVAAFHVVLARVLGERGRYEEALAAFQQTLRLAPNHLEARLGVCSALQGMGRLADAEAGLRHVLDTNPPCARAHYALGSVLQVQGRTDEAIASFKAAIRCRSDFAAAYNDLGAVLLTRGAAEPARRCLERALRLRPDFAEAHFNLGDCLTARGELQEAEAAYVRSLERAPERLAAPLLFRLALVRRRLADWTDHEAQTAKLIAATERHLRTYPDDELQPLTLNYLDVPANLRLAVARHQASAIARKVSEARARCRFTHPRAHPERLRIGYVSPDFRQHAVGLLLQGTFVHHDRSFYEVYAYSLVDCDDAFTRSIRRGCDAFVDISRLTPEQAARRIYADGIHILIDLGGYTTHTRTTLFALEPAPVQAHYLGYLDTMGAPYLPYVIADELAVPREVAAHFSEAVVYLPDGFVAAAPLPVPETPVRRRDIGLPEGTFVFCCFNAVQKIDPAVFAVWMRILQRVPHGVLWLYGDDERSQENLRREAAARGVDPGRLAFSRRLPLPEYLAQHRLADLFLDTFVYNAGTTAVCALWAGLPVLTRPGATYLSRMGASLASAAGLPEMVCADEEAYEERAVELATRPEKLEEVRWKLVEARATGPLFDPARLVRHLEEAYRMMWEDYVEGRPSCTLRVPRERVHSEATTLEHT